MGTGVEVTPSVEPFCGQGQAGQKPDHQQAVPFMVASRRFAAVMREEEGTPGKEGPTQVRP